jgi:hypothetical protein
LSALQLDELALRGGSDAHLASCARCQADADELAAVRAEFRPRPDAIVLRAPWRRWWWMVVPAAVAAALALVYLQPAGLQPAGLQPAGLQPAGLQPAGLQPAGLRPATTPDLGVKGSEPTLRVFANHAGDVFSVHDGTRLVAGDRIRFVVEPAGMPYVLIASIDSTGAATVYYPYGGIASAAIPPAERSELPGSIILDAAPGPERVFAMFSDAPIASAAVLDQLRQVGTRGSSAIWTQQALQVDSVRAQQSIVFDKGAP